MKDVDAAENEVGIDRGRDVGLEGGVCGTKFKGCDASERGSEKGSETGTGNPASKSKFSALFASGLCGTHNPSGPNNSSS